MRRIPILLVALVCGLFVATALAQPKASNASASAPVFSSPSPVTFDFVSVGATSATRIATIRNTGDATLKFSAVDLGGRDSEDFRIASGNCAGSSLAPNATCDVGIQFAPSAPGTRVAYLRFTDNTPCHNWINLAGSGVATRVTTAHASTCETGGDSDAPSGTTTVTNTVTTPGATTPASSTVNASSVVGLPTRCSSRRTVVVRLTAPSGQTFKVVKVMLHGKTLKTLSGKAIKTKISLRGLPRGRFTLQVRATTSDGKSFVRKHYYVTCVASK
jgi:hypothetical protein